MYIINHVNHNQNSILNYSFGSATKYNDVNNNCNFLQLCPQRYVREPALPTNTVDDVILGRHGSVRGVCGLRPDQPWYRGEERSDVATVRHATPWVP